MPTILLVDDYEMILRVYEQLLQEAIPGCRILTATNEENAIEFINKEEAIDVIITDLSMTHDTGGLNVLAEAKKKDPLIMVIVITAYEKKLNRNEAFELGAFDCIIKANSRNNNNNIGEDELVYKTQNAIFLRKYSKQVAESSAQKELDYFKRYFDPLVFHRITKDKTLLHPKHKFITVVFWDIRGFSSLCNKLKTKPQLIAGFLKDYFEIASTIIFKKTGVLDKFIGDGVMALFGAFEGDEETEKNAVLAVEAAKELKKRFDFIYAKHKELWRFQTPDTIDIGLGCGIHTDEIIVGNLGTDQREHYTAIGYGVNFAARLEKEAQKGKILFSATTNSHVRKHFATKELEKPIEDIKGIPGSFKIYELIDTSDDE